MTIDLNHSSNKKRCGCNSCKPNRAWAHWQENSNSEVASRPISYAELVKRTGVQFLPGVVPR